MKAIQVSQPGGPEALTLVDLPIPTPKANEAVVKLGAAGVNFIDVYFREGRYPTALPFVDGQEGAGVITEVGSEVAGLKPGDRVTYTGALGSYAEYQAVPADRLVRIPANLDDRHAAAGGVGLLLVQMAHQLGARVIGTVSTEHKARLARDAGAQDVILYTQQDFVAETRRLTGGRGVDVVYDGVGKATFDGGLEVLRPRGYMVLFGGASGAVPPFDPIKLSQKGSLFLTRPTLAHHIARREELEWRATEVMNWIATGQLNLHIEHIY